MSASRIKNLILLILLLGVLGLLPAVVPTQAARTGAERNVHEKLEDLYSSYGLTLDASSLPDSQTLYAIEIENPDASNAAQALLGSKYTAGETAAWFCKRTHVYLPQQRPFPRGRDVLSGGRDGARVGKCVHLLRGRAGVPAFKPRQPRLGGK